MMALVVLSVMLFRYGALYLLVPSTSLAGQV